MFPTMNRREDNVRILYDQVTDLIVPSYMRDFIANLAHPRKIDAIKIIRLVYPGLGLLEAKLSVELMTGQISPGERDGRVSITSVYVEDDDYFKISIITFDQTKSEDYH